MCNTSIKYIFLISIALIFLGEERLYCFSNVFFLDVCIFVIPLIETKWVFYCLLKLPMYLYMDLIIACRLYLNGYCLCLGVVFGRGLFHLLLLRVFGLFYYYFVFLSFGEIDVFL